MSNLIIRVVYDCTIVYSQRIDGFFSGCASLSAFMAFARLKTFIKADKSPKILEDFISLGYTANELVNMSDVEFLNVFERTFTPMNQIALNMGFETWKY